MSHPEVSYDGETPLAYRVVRGGIWVAVSSYWTVGFGFAATLAITHILDPDAFGIFALAAFFAQLFRLQTKLGLGYAFVQRQDASDGETSTYLTMDFLTVMGGLLLALAAAPILLVLGYSDTLVQVSVVLALGAMLEGITSIGATFLDKALHFSQASLVQSIVFPISYIPAFWMAFNAYGVWSLVAQNLTYNLLFLAGVWWAVHRHVPQIWKLRWDFNSTTARQFLRFGVTVGLGLMATTLLTQLDNFLIGTLVGVTVLGYYDRAYRIAQWPAMLLSGVVTRAAFYTYARLQDDPVRLQKTITMLLWLVTTVALPIALIIFITAPDLIALLYGERWLPSALFLRILVIYSVVRPLWENAGTLFVAIGKPRLTAIFVWIQTLVLAAIGLPLTIVWGAIGTCIAVGLAFISGMVLIYRDVMRHVPVDLKSSLGIPGVTSAAIVLGYLAIGRLIDLNSITLLARVASKSAYAVLAFLMLMLIFQPRTTYERVQYIWRLAMRTRESGVKQP